MSREQINKSIKKDCIKSSNKKEELMRRLKQYNNSDSDSINDSNDEDSSSNTNESDGEKLNIIEYRKMLSKIFPSKHINKKVKAGKVLQNKIKEDVIHKGKLNQDAVCDDLPCPKKKDTKKESSTKESIDYEYNKKRKSKNGSCYKSYNTIREPITKESSSEESSDDGSNKMGKKNEKVNIILTIGNSKYNDSDCDSDDSSYIDNSGSSVWEDTTEDDVTENEDEPIEIEEENKTIIDTSIIENDEELLIQLKDIYEKNTNNQTIKECIQRCEAKIKNKQIKLDNIALKYKERNGRIFKKIIKDKNTLNDFKFFKELDKEHQNKIIKELREINKLSRVEKPYRITLLETDMPVLFKCIAMKKINSLRYIDPGNSEYYKLKNWVGTFMRIPFSKYNSLPISILDGVDKCHEFMENAQNILNEAVYGLNDAKMQIMQMLGQLITNPKSIGSAIAIHGPPGTGKTSLIKEGISKILNRPFAFIALGGATDSSFLEGHSYTYEGSTWGKIIQIIIDSKCMNPVIYFDELDKISETPKGDEIAGILTHLTDTSQNNQFHDKYFSEVDFDLSKCLFIFSYNDETKVSPILRDRMYKIQTKGYDKKQKMIISNNYLLPKIREQINFNSSEIIISEEAINYIIEHNCNNEDGVRNLKRCLEIIYTKLNLYRLMKPGTNLFEQDMTLTVEFPFTVTKNMVDKLIKLRDENQIFKHLYV
jgi:ATP-dependent Lon protease